MRKILNNIWTPIIAGFIIIVLAIVGYQYFLTDSAAEPVIESVPSDYPGVHLETITAETDDYVMSIQSPTVEDSTTNDAIQSWLYEQRDTFIEQTGNTDLLSMLNIKLDTIPLTDGVYNLVFSSYQIAGGANGYTTYQTFNIDTNNHKHLELSDMVDTSSDSFAQIIKDTIAKDKDLAAGVDPDFLDESLQNTDQLNWSLSDENLSLYWDDYDIAAGYIGPVQLDIPIAEIEDLLSVSAKDYLAMPVVEESEEQAPDLERPEQEEVELDLNGKYVALTFDDGPNPNTTPRVLDILKSYDIPGTFYMLGSQVDYYPTLVQDVYAQGHEIGNHSNSHADLSYVDAATLNDELYTTNELIYKAIGEYPKTVRPPYGSYNERLLNVVGQTGQQVVLWSVDSLDWQSRNTEAINREVMNQVHPGAIILMHDIHETTVDALPTVLDNLKAQGYEFLTVSQLLEWRQETGTGPYF